MSVLLWHNLAVNGFGERGEEFALNGPDPGPTIPKGAVTLRKKKISEISSMTKGQMEAEISNALISFEKEHMGRGPIEARTHIIQDIVMIRLKGVLTPAETHLAKDDEGIQLIKQIRAKLLEKSRDLLVNMITEITGCATRSFHTDISTRTGERFIIITLSEDLGSKFPS